MRISASKRTLFLWTARGGWRLLLGLALLLGSAAASAVSATLSVPTADEDGTFTASWNVDPGPNQGGYTQLKQRVSGGSWVVLVQKGFGSQSHSVTVDSNGTYEFLVHYAYMPQNPCGGPGCNPQLIHGETPTYTVLIGPPPAPTVSAGFSPSTINEGQSSLLSWSSNHATSCSASGISGVSGTSGSVSWQAPLNMSADINKSVTVSCSGSGGSTSKTATVHADWVNDSPSISNISNHSTYQGTVTSAIGFTVGDEESPAASLTISAASSNQTIISNSKIQLGGSGVNRTITVTPEGTIGSATITVTVSDGSKSSSDSFVVSVRDMPATLDLPASNNTGIFTVIFGGGTTYSLLQEDVNGTWETVSGVDGYALKSEPLTRGEDTHTFRLQDCEVIPNPPSGAITECSTVLTKSIVVDLPAPVVTASFNKQSLNEGESATFTWSTSGANSCSGTGLSGLSGTSGNVTYSAPVELANPQTVTASLTCVGDGGTTTAADSLTVNPVNDAPTISAIPVIKTYKNAEESLPVSFTVNDIDNNNGALTLSATSSNNSSLVPTANVYFGGSGSNRKVWVTPVAEQSGSATITVRVSDGYLTATKSLVVEVASAPTVPVFSGDPLATASDPTNDTLSGSMHYGGVKGSYSVGNDGSFRYDVPFVIPPGIQGMAPAIGLSYNSGMRSSVVGWGWSLTGLTYIHRCPADYHRDARVSSIRDEDDYQYCLDGSRLVPIGNNEYRTESESFLHITKHSDYWTVVNQAGTVARYGYDANAKELSAAGTHTWKQDRQEDTFGNYLTIEYEAGQVNGADYGRPSRITYTQNDSVPNMPAREIVFGYTLRPDIISGYMAGRPYIENKRLSSVTVKNNGTELWTYSLGYEDENPSKTVDDPAAKSLLDTIQRCFSGGGCEEALTADWSKRRKSDYKYIQMDSGFWGRRNELGEVDHYFDINGDGIEDGYIGYADSEPLTYYDVGYNGIRTSHQLIPKSEFHDIDINGDGYKDIVRFNPTISGIEVYMNEPDGNGGRKISSVASPNYQINSEYLTFYAERRYTVYKNLNTEFVKANSYRRESKFGYNIQFFDYNHDGLIDLIRTPPACPDTTICEFLSDQYAQDISILLNSGAGWQKENAAPNFIAIYDQWDNEKQLTAIQLADLNGDRHYDIYGKGTLPDGNPKLVYLISSSADDINQVVYTDVTNTAAWANLGEYIGDFDGDGLLDFADVSPVSIKVNRGKGGTFTTPTIGTENTALGNCASGRSAISYCTNVVVDFNSDGLEDIVQMAGCSRLSDFEYDDGEQSAISSIISDCYSVMSSMHKEQVWLSKGLNDSGNIEFSDPIVFKNYYDGISPYTRALHMQFADYNNDGIQENTPQDTVNFEELRIESIYSKAQDVAINYRSFDMTSVFLNGGELPGDDHLKKVHELDEDYIELTPAKRSATRFGVESLEVSDGIGGTNTISYTYEGAKFDTASYGHLGFEKIESTEQISGESGYIRTESHYHQEGNDSYQLSRKLKRRKRYAGEESINEVLISDERYQWKIKLYNDDSDGHQSPHYFAYVYEQSTTSFDLNGDAIGTSVTRNHSASSYDCTALTVSDTESVDTYLAGASDDLDYDNEGVLLESVTTTCDAYSADALAPLRMTQIVAMENADVINRGERRGLVQTSRSASWFGPSTSVPSGDLWSLAVNGVDATASCSATEAQTAPWASKTAYVFDSKGLLRSKTVRPQAGAGKTVTATFNYNTTGSVKTATESWTNPSGDNSLAFTSRSTTTEESFNGNGQRVVKTTTPLGQSTVIYDGVFDAPRTNTDVNGLVTTTGYDKLGRVTSITSPNTTVTRLYYRTCNNCFSESVFAQSYTQTKTTGQSASRTYFDRLGRSVGTRSRGFDGSYVYTSTVYGRRGLAEGTVAPYFDGEPQQLTYTSYDLLNRPVDVIRPDLNSTHFVYAGLRREIHNVNGQVQTRFSSAGGNVLRNVDNADTPVDFSYWPNGSVKTTEVGGGANPETKVCVGFDDMGRKNFLDDPNTGRTTYHYNALGLLASQIDAKGQVTRFEYDVLGRTVKRRDDADGENLSHTWSYDSQLLGLADSLSGENTDGSSYQESWTYNSYGQQTGTTADYLGKSFNSVVGFDSYGRVQNTIYPGGYEIANIYNAWGNVAKVVETGGNQILWQADQVNARGQVTQATLGDSSVVERAYTPETGLIETIRSSRRGQVLMDHFYDFDPLGNLEERTDHLANQTEAFCYDGLNRLVAARTSSCNVNDGDFSYDSLGNILSKQGVSGTYAYGNNAGPHAVTAANGLFYSYDANGNLTESRDITGDLVREITYSAFDKPVAIEKDNWASHIVYGATHSRIKRTDYEGTGVKRTTFYFGSMYEETESQRIYYIGDFAQRIEGVNTGESYHEFLHRDHIGSVAAKSTDRDYNPDKGAFGPWGRRLEDTWNSDPTGPGYSDTSLRGFTGHEHLDPVGLIHMNGRVYDPELGRFLSPDPVVQAPYNTQNYNRYSYVWNNPLSLVDPSGYYCRGMGQDAMSQLMAQTAFASIDNMHMQAAMDTMVSINRYQAVKAARQYRQDVATVRKWIDNNPDSSWSDSIAQALPGVFSLGQSNLTSGFDLDTTAMAKALAEDVANAGPAVDFLNGNFSARRYGGGELTADDISNVQGYLDEIATGKEGKAFLDSISSGKVKAGVFIGNHGKTSISMMRGPEGRKWIYFDANAVQFHRMFDVNSGKMVVPSATRVFLHEMGHAFKRGLSDNILPNLTPGEAPFRVPAIEFENRIMEPIDGYRRRCDKCIGGY